MKTIGEIIKEKRENLSFSMYQLAKQADITAQYINDIEKNKKKSPPTDETLTKIAIALKMNDEEIKELIKLANLEKTPQIIKNEFLKMQIEIDKLKKEIESLKNNSSGDTYSNNTIKNVKGSIHINIKNGNKKDYSENDIIEKINELSVEQQKEVFKFIEFQSFQKK